MRRHSGLILAAAILLAGGEAADGTSALAPASVVAYAEGVTLEQVLAAYAAGERWTLAGVRRVGRSLGTGVANLVNIFNPELIVFGGAVRHIFTATEPLVREALAGALDAPGQHVRLAVAGLADDSVLVGAAELAFAPLLADPLGLLLAHRDALVAAGA